MLTQRHNDILKMVVQAHIEGGEPVGSKTVSERCQLGLSPATVRNAMSELEEMGFLAQPHASAGRVPTDLGLRIYADSLLEVADLSNQEKEQILQACEQGKEDWDATLTRVSQLLATMTLNACLVRTPSSQYTLLQRIQFIKLGNSPGGERILALLISHSGQLRSRVFHLESRFSQEKLDFFSHSLSRHLEGMTLSQVRNHLKGELELGEKEYKTLCGNLLESLSSPFIGGELIVNGRMNVFNSFANLARIQEMLTVLEEKKSLIHLLDECLNLEGVRLFIGSESNLGKRGGCTVVAAHFKDYNGLFPGTLGVLGPTHMDYAHVIPLVDFTTKVLSTLFSDASTVSNRVKLPLGNYTHIGETSSL